jgi:hypothetical protein
MVNGCKDIILLPEIHPAVQESKLQWVNSSDVAESKSCIVIAQDLTALVLVGKNYCRAGSKSLPD